MNISSNPFSADLVHLDGNAVVVLVGELDLATAPLLTGVLDPLVEDGPPEIVLDCAALTFLDSSGITVLVRAQNRLSQMQRRLVVRAPRPTVLRGLEITGVVKLLRVEGGTDQVEDNDLTA